MFTFQKLLYLFSLKINFVLENSAYPDEMPRSAVFHVGFYCLKKYPFRDCQTAKG